MNKQKGVTLIALIVTIVVLIIIAGISITALTGDDGVVKEAQETTSSAERVSIIQKVAADLHTEKTKTGREQTSDDLINIIEENGYGTVTTVNINPRYNVFISTNGYEIEFSEIPGWEMPLIPGETAKSTLKNNYIDTNGDKATIPEDFTISSKEPEETIIDNGLVVIAPDGSEFVWVPVPTVVSDTQENATTNKAMAIQDGRNYKGLLYDFSGTSSTVRTVYTRYTYREPVIVEDSDEEGIIGMTEESIQNEYDKMIESVKIYNGFYIGRYESSLNSENKIKSEYNVRPTNDASLWYGLYEKQKEYSTSSVQGSMIWGSQYDAMLNWALNGTDKSKVTTAGNGNHSNSIINTGTTGDDKINNIYDLEGNLREWTLEAYNTYARTTRGGGIVHVFSPSERAGFDPDFHYGDKGSRLTLYIK